MFSKSKIEKLEKEIEPLVQEEFNKWKIEEGFVDENGKPLEAVFGSCHTYWNIKKRLMKEKYNVDWKTPAELNPGIQFD